MTIIEIENMEHFRNVRKQKFFFKEYLHKHGFSQKVLSI